MKNKIVCDTNVWYYVENGKIKLEDYNLKFPLYSTYLSLNELLTTVQWNSNPELIFRVIETMRKNSFIILATPQNYVTGICLGIESDILNNNTILEMQYKLMFCQAAKEDFYSTSTEKTIFKAWIDYVNNFNLYHQETANYAEMLVHDLQKQAINKEYKKAVYENKKASEAKSNLFTESKYRTIFGEDLSKLPIYLSQFELFNNTQFQFIKSIRVAGFGHNANDFEDMDNLMYVNEGDLYWTEENRWLNLIKEAGMTKYLERPKVNTRFIY